VDAIFIGLLTPPVKMDVKDNFGASLYIVTFVDSLIQPKITMNAGEALSFGLSFDIEFGIINLD